MMVLLPRDVCLVQKQETLGAAFTVPDICCLIACLLEISSRT